MRKKKKLLSNSKMMGETRKWGENKSKTLTGNLSLVYPVSTSEELEE